MRWLLVKDLQILRRSPLLVAMLVLYPILIAALVGFAVTSGPSKPRVALLNQVRKEKNRVSLGGENVNVAQEAKPLFDAITVVRVKTEAEAIAKVRSGDVLAALILPADITQQLQEATSGSGTRPTVRVYYNAEDPAKQAFVENTIKARVQEANAALSKKVTQVALSYLKLIGSGGQFAFLGRTFDVRGLVTQTQLLVEKIGLAALCSVLVGLVLLVGLSVFVNLPWSRFPLWLLALIFGAAAFGALGVAFGALTREVRAASLLAFMASLPIAVLGLVPSGAVSNALYDVIRTLSAVFPVRAKIGRAHV